MKILPAIIATIVVSLAWGAICYFLKPPQAVSFFVGMPLGAVAMTAGLWWGNR